MLHEAQHAVQGVEDFAPGTNPQHLAQYGEEILKNKGISMPPPKEGREALDKAALNLYKRHSGEDESNWIEALRRQPLNYPNLNLVGRSQQVVPGSWLERQTPEIQDYVRNTMTHQFQGGPPTLQNYINLLKLDAR